MNIPDAWSTNSAFIFTTDGKIAFVELKSERSFSSQVFHKCRLINLFKNKKINVCGLAFNLAN